MEKKWRENKVKLILLIISSFFVLQSFAQQPDDADKIVQQFLEQRKKMMEEVMKAFDDDEFFKRGDDSFDDKMFDQIRKHGFRGFQGFSSSGNNVKVEERVEKDGSISVIITPKNEKIKLDIKSTKDQIVIKSEMMSDVENKNAQVTTKSYSKSSYSQTIRIPNGFEAQSPKAKDKSIIIKLTPKAKGKFKPDSKGRVPVQKGYGEETI
tara:strand:+ start:254 stop:880 length:627 start_codon:yes stop_codon:yes gene_type:complete